MLRVCFHKLLVCVVWRNYLRVTAWREHRKTMQRQRRRLRPRLRRPWQIPMEEAAAPQLLAPQKRLYLIQISLSISIKPAEANCTCTHHKNTSLKYGCDVYCARLTPTQSTTQLHRTIFALILVWNTSNNNCRKVQRVQFSIKMVPSCIISHMPSTNCSGRRLGSSSRRTSCCTCSQMWL